MPEIDSGYVRLVVDGETIGMATLFVLYRANAQLAVVVNVQYQKNTNRKGVSNKIQPHAQPIVARLIKLCRAYGCSEISVWMEKYPAGLHHALTLNGFIHEVAGGYRYDLNC